MSLSAVREERQTLSNYTHRSNARLTNTAAPKSAFTGSLATDRRGAA